jgi:hypothetical protein
MHDMIAAGESEDQAHLLDHHGLVSLPVVLRLRQLARNLERGGAAYVESVSAQSGPVAVGCRHDARTLARFLS